MMTFFSSNGKVYFAVLYELMYSFVVAVMLGIFVDVRETLFPANINILTHLLYNKIQNEPSEL